MDLQVPYAHAATIVETAKNFQKIGKKIRVTFYQHIQQPQML